MGHGKSRGTRRHRGCNQHRKSAFPTIDNCETYRCTMFKTQWIDKILFANEFRREHAGTLISRTCGISSTHIDNWCVAPEKWHHKQKPKATNVTCVNTTQEMVSQTKAKSNQRHLCQHMEKWSRPPHPKPSTPFGSTLQTTCHPRSRRTERPRFEVKSSMSVARVGCGNFAWSMGTNPSHLVNTDIPSQKNNSVCQY